MWQLKLCSYVSFSVRFHLYSNQLFSHQPLPIMTSIRLVRQKSTNRDKTRHSACARQPSSASANAHSLNMHAHKCLAIKSPWYDQHVEWCSHLEPGRMKEIAYGTGQHTFKRRGDCVGEGARHSSNATNAHIWRLESKLVWWHSHTHKYIAERTHQPKYDEISEL